MRNLRSKQALYESIMQDVSKIVRRHLNESSSNVSWDATFTDNEIAHLRYGYDFDELEPGEQQKVKQEMNRQIKWVKSNISTLKNMGIDVDIDKINGYIGFQNLNETNILDFSDFLCSILNTCGEAYWSDFESCVNYQEIYDYLEQADPQLCQQWDNFLDSALFH